MEYWKSYLIENENLWGAFEIGEEPVEEIVVVAAEHMHVKMNLLFLMIEYLKKIYKSLG
jgi:hypothetical protein